MSSPSDLSLHNSQTLREAIAQLTGGAPASSTPPDPSLTAAWMQSCARGDEGKFRARLAWDGLTPETVPLLAAMPAREGDSPWRALLWKALTLFKEGRRLSPAASAAFREARLAVPFLELWDAFAAAGLEWVPPALRTPEVEWFLSRRLSPLGSPVLYHDFAAFRAAFTGTSDAYAAWLEDARKGGLQRLLQTYPVLARGLASITVTAAATLTDFHARLEADRRDLGLLFGDLGDFSGIDPGLSDRHYDGRQVARVRFTSGRSLIYKPKSVDLDAAFQRLLQTLGGGTDVPLPAPLRILARDGYGWVEHVDHHAFTDSMAAAQYFRQGGGLLALVYALEGRDFIMDNIIATDKGPAAIDAEAALQPLCMPGGAEHMDRPDLIRQLLKGRDYSVLDTGLIPLWMPGGKGCYDMSGLGGQTGYVSALQQEHWEATGTGSMSCTRRPVEIEPEKNRVDLLGAPQTAASHAREVDGGFTTIYQLILDRRPEILTEIASWQKCQLRFLLRPTNTYGQILQRMLAAGSLISGLRAGMEAELLYRPFISSPAPPPIAPFLTEEVTALERWDIPCFHLPAGGSSSAYFLMSPLGMAEDRIRRLDADDLAKQRRVIQTSLTLQPRPDLGGTGQPHDPFPGLTLARQQQEPAWQMPEASLLDQAEAIAGILEQLPGAATGPSQVLLFEGAAGPAVFFAALARVTGKECYAASASQRVEDWLMDAYSREFRESVTALPVGGASGLASLPYSCWVLSRLLDRPDLLERAAELAELVSHRGMFRDTQLDLYSGAAGAAMVFAALSGATGGAAVFRDRTAWAVEHLLDSMIRVQGGEGRCWLACGERYLGYGHGAAGIATALLRASTALGNADAGTAGRQCLGWLATLNTAEAGWPHLLRGDEPVVQKMESLCHGTPGLTLAYAEATTSGAFDGASVLERLTRRLDQLPPHPIDTICCGNAGRLEALLAAGTPAISLASLLLVMLKRREPTGLFRTDFRRSDTYTCPPGFYKGLSGIGYQLLRLARPGLLPSLPAWQ